MGKARPFSVVPGGLGETHTGSVTHSEVVQELSSRGYNVHVEPEPEPEPKGISKAGAIQVAVDEAIYKLGLPRTSYRPFRCPNSGGCGLTQSTWNTVVSWCVEVANGYLTGKYALPQWAVTAMHAGALHGLPMGRMAGLSGFGDWIKANPWFVESVGTTIANYGEFLTAQDVKEAIKKNTEKSLTKDDMVALIQELQAGQYIPAGKMETVATGANMAAGNSWTMPLMLLGGVAVIMMLMKK